MIGEDLKAASAVLDGVYKTIESTLNKIGLGGIDDGRFTARRSEIDSIFDLAGYDGGVNGRDVLYSDYKIYGEPDVPAKKTKGNYASEFARLAAYTVARLNLYNPGLGQVWLAKYPMKMSSLGQIHGNATAGLRELVNKYPPGKYDGSMELTSEPTAANPGFFTASTGNSGTMILMIGVLILLLLFSGMAKKLKLNV